MPTANFYLKKPEKSTGKSLIYLQFKFRDRLVFSFNETIDPKNWDKKKQRVKGNKKTANGEHMLNDLLDNLKRVCENAYKAELKNGIPTPVVLKRHLIEFMQQNLQHQNDSDSKNFFQLAQRFVSGEIKYKGREKSLNTIKTYNTTIKHLKDFEKKKKYAITYDSMDLNFLYKYISFLRELGLKQNAIAKDIQIIKTFLKKATTLRESNNTWYEHEEFTAAREETDSVYLNTSEILKLYKHDFSQNKRFEATRDLFVFGCFVGLRFSDFSQIKPEYITKYMSESGESEYYIKMITQKTKDTVIIPCNPIVLEIFEKYAGNTNRLPRAVSNQKFNETIKEVCRHAQFNETGRLVSHPEKPLYNCISSHTARRSFATNLYLEDFPVNDLMKITGHRTEKAFKAYIKVSKLDAAKRLNSHMKKTWSQRLLRVAS